MSLLCNAINEFSFSLYKELSEKPGNVFFSPFSISTSLSILLCGARDHTEQEMRQVLHFESAGIPTSEVHSIFEQLLSVFNKASDDITLSFANAILSQKDMTVLSEFKTTVEKTYRALHMEVDFVGENAKVVAQINDWVKKETNEMIQSVIESLDPSIVMVLLNAIYFKGLWACQFNPERTKLEVFYNRGQPDGAKEVPMMFISETFEYTQEKSYKALVLPYKNDAIVMILLLPNEMDGLQNLENQLTNEFFRDTLSSLCGCKVDVTLPKFRIEYTASLSENLAKLGMVSAFQISANFTGINSEEIYVSEVITKSVLDVNEEGSEAAAVTVVKMMKRKKKSNRKFEANHPFLCIIYDKEKDMILFIGKVLEI